jgi:chaperonin cofactor prefoldin
MTPEEVLKQLEKHEESCDKRYEQIQKQLTSLDIKVWGIAVLIIIAPFAQKLFS